GSFGVAHEEGRRICRCLFYVRHAPEDNGYAHPVEGVVAFVDMARGEVLEIVDTGVVPIPTECANYFPESVQQRQDLLPIEITQPQGPSFSVDGNRVRWQKWSLRVSMDSIEGLVLHEVGYEDDGRLRPILFRASVSEMVVPYGDPGPMHGWKNAFDAGEWGLGRMTNALTLGCDCLGVIHYFDAVFSSERGHPYVVKNAICMHEEDYGILWKHNDPRSDRNEVRRSRRLVVSSIATVGNYDYGFYWYFYLDGAIECEIKLTGVLFTAAHAGGDNPYSAQVAPGLGAPVHQHLFGARLDMTVDGLANAVEEVDVSGLPIGPDNPYGNAIAQTVTRLRRESQSGRRADGGRGRTWRVINTEEVNRFGRPVSYTLYPEAAPVLLADPGSSLHARAAFATNHLWVTRYEPSHRYPAGDFVNQHPGGAGLPEFVARDRDIDGADIVVWHTFGPTHFPRPEDWPVMPVARCGFTLKPTGFFNRNPTLDVPPPAGHCPAG
ncbi:MAG TPA: primary-amine oxidase, partial [Streptosporangiaceae bacterium]|nr:primary-amine oxidase [Streptosporangiaceae bacterium]